MFKTRDQMSTRHPEWDTARLDREQNKQMFYGLAAASLLAGSGREPETHEHTRHAPLTDAQRAYVDDYWSGPIMSKIASALWFVRNCIVYGVVLAGVGGLGVVGWHLWKTLG